MPTYVFKCESCGEHKPFLVHESETTEVEKNPIERHCPTCRRTTNWTLAFPERRSGRDRRQTPDRRSHTP